jgi:hypothetical protein
VTNAIQSAIDNLVNQIPGGSSVQKDVKAAFVDLLERVVRDSGQSTATPEATTPAATASATQLMPHATSSSGDSLWRDPGLAALEQLPNDLTAENPAYDQREATLRGRLDVSELEQRLRGYAQSVGIDYSSTDLDGILRNAGYGAAHLGSSDRYMAAVEHFTNEAYNNYRQRAGNVPGANA